MTDDDHDPTEMRDDGIPVGDPSELTPGYNGSTTHADDPVNYSEIPIPGDIPSSEYSRFQRRAVILRRIERAGHPQALPYTYKELGDEFDVAQSTINTDMTRIREYVQNDLSREHKSIGDSVFRGKILDILEDDDADHRAAPDVIKMWYDWLADLGEETRVADKVDLDVEQSERESEDYVVIDDADPNDAAAAPVPVDDATQGDAGPRSCPECGGSLTPVTSLTSSEEPHARIECSRCEHVTRRVEGSAAVEQLVNDHTRQVSGP